MMFVPYKSQLALAVAMCNICRQFHLWQSMAYYFPLRTVYSTQTNSMIDILISRINPNRNIKRLNNLVQ